MRSLIFSAALLALSLAAQADTDALLQSADAPRVAFLHTIVDVRATIGEKDKPDRIAEFELYVGGEDRQLVIFKDEKNRGRKFIINGDKTWLIAPNASRPVAITARQRLIGGASFSDVAHLRLSRDYNGVLRERPEPCGELAQPCRVLDILANTKSVAYATGTLWIDDKNLVRRAVYVLASGKPAREAHFTYRDGNGQATLSKAVIVDLLSGEQTLTTTLDYVRYRKAPMADELFDPERAVQAPSDP